jgi:hypothetical protein
MLQPNDIAQPVTDAELPSAVSPNQLLNAVVLQTPQPPTRADGIAVGTVDGLTPDGTVLVSIPAFGLSRIPSRSIGSVGVDQTGNSVALGFEGGDPHLPIILGPLLAVPAAKPAPELNVALDGERVVLKAQHEIELRCGEAALVLSADGRIQLRGTYITSHASATQRILGGSVNIN